MRVRWADSALDDVEQIVLYINRFNPLAARRVAQAILDAGDGLSRFPMKGRAGSEPGTRELVVVWPYVIVYEVEPDAVQVLRVWHGAQERG